MIRIFRKTYVKLGLKQVATIGQLHLNIDILVLP